MEQHRREEGALFSVDATEVALKHFRSHRADLRRLRRHVGALRQSGERAEERRLVPRVTRRGFGEAGGERPDHCIHMGAGRNDAADGGAFLTRLNGDLPRRLLDKGVELRRVRRSVGAKDGGVEAVRLRMEPHGVRQQVRIRPQHCRRIGGAGETDHILRAETVQQVARRPADQLHRAFGQDA